MLSNYEIPNKVVLPAQGIGEVVPITQTFTALQNVAGNALLSALRFNVHDANDAGLDISTIASISGNIVMLSNLWLSTDTPAEGEYRVQLIARNTDGSIQQEFNLMYVVTAR